jgi:hypothetical protein
MVERRSLARGTDHLLPPEVGEDAVRYRVHDEADLDFLVIPLLVSVRQRRAESAAFLRAGCELAIFVSGRERRITVRGGAKESVAWTIKPASDAIDVPVRLEVGRCFPLIGRRLELGVSVCHGISGIRWPNQKRLEPPTMGSGGVRLWGAGVNVGLQVF